MLEDERKAHEETSKARLQAFTEKESNILERQRKYVKEIEKTSQELKNALKTSDSQLVRIEDLERQLEQREDNIGDLESELEQCNFQIKSMQARLNEEEEKYVTERQTLMDLNQQMSQKNELLETQIQNIEQITNW